MGNWQNAEASLAKWLREAGIPAYRDIRLNYAKKDFEVKVIGDNRWKIDSKYRTVQPWRHHGTLEEIEKKYCSNPTKYRKKQVDIQDVPVLFTKNYKDDHGYVTIHVKVFAQLLQAYLEKTGYDFESGWEKYAERLKDINGDSSE